MFPVHVCRAGMGTVFSSLPHLLIIHMLRIDTDEVLPTFIETEPWYKFGNTKKKNQPYYLVQPEPHIVLK